MTEFMTDCICLTASPGDENHSGLCNTYTAGENVAYGDVVYMKSDGKFWKTDADAAATMPGVAVATDTILTDATGMFLIFGYLELTSWDWTIGGIVYASTTPGEFTQTAPSGTGDQVQILGLALTADIILFKPDLTLVEVA